MEGRMRADLWLQRILMLVVAAFLGACCYFVWRLSMIAYRVEQAVVSVSADVKQVTGTVANIARRVDEISERVCRLEKKSSDAVGLDDFERTLESLAELRKARKEYLPPMGEKVEEEIDFLLAHIRKSDFRFDISGDDYSGLTTYLYFQGKYLAYRKTLQSAEEFIDRVATKTMSGEVYHVLENGKKKAALKEWLTEALRCRRGEKAGAEAAPKEK